MKRELPSRLAPDEQEMTLRALASLDAKEVANGAAILGRRARIEDRFGELYKLVAGLEERLRVIEEPRDPPAALRFSMEPKMAGRTNS